MTLRACAQLGCAWVMQHCCVLLPGGICRRCRNMSPLKRMGQCDYMHQPSQRGHTQYR